MVWQRAERYLLFIRQTPGKTCFRWDNWDIPWELVWKITFSPKEVIIVISVIGTGIACLCSMIVVKILASRSEQKWKNGLYFDVFWRDAYIHWSDLSGRKSASSGGHMSLCTRSVSGYEDMSRQSLLTNSASVTRGLGQEPGHGTEDRSVSWGHAMSRDTAVQRRHHTHTHETARWINQKFKLIGFYVKVNCAVERKTFGQKDPVKIWSFLNLWLT